MNCSLPGFSVHGILQVRILGWGTISSSRRASVHFSSPAQLCPTLCDPTEHIMPGLPVHYQLPNFTQTHVHWVSGAIQPFHPLLSPSPPAFCLSQNRGLFKWVSSLNQVARILSISFNISPSNEHSGLIFRMDWLDFLPLLFLNEVYTSEVYQMHFLHSGCGFLTSTLLWNLNVCSCGLSTYFI